MARGETRAGWAASPPVRATLPRIRAVADPGVGHAHRWLGPKALLVLADLVTIAGSLAAASGLHRWVNVSAPLAPTDRYLVVALVSLPVWMASFVRARLYTSRFLTRRLDEFRRIVRAALGGVLGMAVTAYFLRFGVGRSWVLLSFAVVVVAVGFERELARRWFAAQRRRGRSLRRVVLVGANAEAVQLHDVLQRDPSLGYEVVGVVDDAPMGALPGPLALLGSLADTLDAVHATGARGVIIAATALDLASSNRLIRELTDSGVHVELSSTLIDIAPQRLTVRPLGRFPVVYIEPVERAGWRAAAKRTFDVVTAGLALVCALPVLAVAAVAIKLDSRGPVLFRQERVGRDGRRFELLKLRTMVADAEHRVIDLRHLNEADGPLFKIRDDPRVTRVGRVLRSTSIDELPQLVNVLRGEMSLVGPRPALPSEMLQWHEELHGRLRVKPGITGMWQVSGRSSASFDDYARLDLYYVDNWSLLVDLAILAKTVPAVLLRRGAH